MKAPAKITKRLQIPIFKAEVILVVTDNIARERKKYDHIFGPSPVDQSYAAISSYSRGHRFGLFFDHTDFDMNILAHEVFHLTHRIMDWAQTNFDSRHHEQGALLHGYLMETITKALKWPVTWK